MRRVCYNPVTTVLCFVTNGCFSEKNNRASLCFQTGAEIKGAVKFFSHRGENIGNRPILTGSSEKSMEPGDILLKTFAVINAALLAETFWD